MGRYWADLLFVMGLALVTVGLWLVSPALALVVLGLVVMGVAVAWADLKGR